jgi:hypothetical protein
MLSSLLTRLYTYLLAPSAISHAKANGEEAVRSMSGLLDKIVHHEHDGKQNRDKQDIR